MRKLLLLVCMTLCILQAWAQNRTVTGKVTDENGKPLHGASVTVKGSTTGTTTDAEGTYSLSVSPNARVLMVNSVGFQAQEVSIGNKYSINVQMASTASALDEVVVVGYQTVKKKDLTSSVANVAGKEIENKPLASFTQLLQGKAAGVQITSQSGRPGANAFIRIRGTGSINASSDPLIIIDGIPANTAAFNLLNTNDIEDISVLKDASATAIYGSRGANGVLVVSTKKGRGRAVLSYTFQYGNTKSQELKNAKLMTAMEKLQYEYATGFYTNPIVDTMIKNRITSGVLPTGATLFNITDAQRNAIWDLASSRGTDWRKQLLVEARNAIHEISLSGSADKFSYYMSLNKSDNEGVLYGSYWNRVGGRLNVEYQANDWFKAGTNIGVSSSEESQVREAYNNQNSYGATFFTNPYEPAYLADGKYNPTLQNFNPQEGADNNPQVYNRIGSFATIYGEAKFFKHLTLRSQYGLNYNTFKEEYYLKKGSNLAGILGYDQKRDAGNQDYLYVFTNTANWRQTVDRHTFSVLGGTEFTKDRFYSYSMTARNFPSASLTTLENAAGPYTATTSRSDWSLISYFGQGSYDFDKKYFLSASLRTDGSSRFGKNNKFANFWAVGVSWDLLREKFIHLDKLKVSNLKLRSSLGTSGNNNIGNYTSLGTYALNVKYNDLPAAVPTQLPNPDLTWEKSNNFDIGTDLGFFQNRLNITFDYYYRKTSNMLYQKNVSLQTGFSSYQSNVGDMRNKGFEVLVSGDIIRKSDLIWNVSVLYTNNSNKVLNLYSDNVTDASGIGKLKIGEPVNTFYMVRWAGVDPATGKNMYYKADGSTTTTYSGSDAQLLTGKSPLAKFYGTISSTLSYKGFDLSAQIYYTGGNYIFNYIYRDMVNDASDPTSNLFQEAANFWKKAGDNVSSANILDPTQRVSYNTDRYLQKGDYITLRDVTLGYTLDRNIASKLKMKSLRVFVQGSNLWIGTKFKGTPEIGQINSETGGYQPGQAVLYGYPQVKAVTLGVNVKF